MNKDRPSRILVADDDPVSLRFFVTVLRELGVETVGVANGHAALEACQESSFDLLLLDRRMPGLGGAALLRELRRRGCTTAAVATSAELGSAARTELAAAGYADAVTKPIGVDQLATVLAKHLPNQRGLRRDANATLHANSTNAPSFSDILEDEPALASVGGDKQTLQALRGLFAKELAAALPAIASMTTSELGEWLHRLRASCRYCGARRLGDESEKLEIRLKAGDGCVQNDMEAFLEVCALTIDALSK